MVPLVVRWPRCAAQPEHLGQLRHDLLLHLGRGRAAVQGVVVRVDQHRGQVPGHRGRVRRLEHLPGIGRVEERVVVPQPPGELAEHLGEPLVADLQRLRAAGTGRSSASQSPMAARPSLSQRCRSMSYLMIRYWALVDISAVDMVTGPSPLPWRQHATAPGPPFHPARRQVHISRSDNSKKRRSRLCPGRAAPGPGPGRPGRLGRRGSGGGRRPAPVAYVANVDVRHDQPNPAGHWPRRAPGLAGSGGPGPGPSRSRLAAGRSGSRHRRAGP